MASAKRIRLTVTEQRSGKSSVVIVQNFDDLRRQCTGKLRLKSPRFFLANNGEEILTDLSHLSNDMKLIVTSGDLYVPVISSSTPIIHDTSSISIRIIANQTLVEQAAVDQLNNVAKIYAKVKQIWGKIKLVNRYR